jgi:hypothetical protein
MLRAGEMRAEFWGENLQEGTHRDIGAVSCWEHNIKIGPSQIVLRPEQEFPAFY